MEPPDVHAIASRREATTSDTVARRLRRASALSDLRPDSADGRAFVARPSATSHRLIAPSLLFVCLGNICRSPLAEAAMRAEAGKRGLDLTIESAGTGSWHIGKPPDARAIAEAARHGSDISGYKARQIVPADFIRHTHIFALDTNNLADLAARAPAHATAEISLLMDSVSPGENRSVSDPYYGGESDFAQTWREVSQAAAALAARFAPAHD